MQFSLAPDHPGDLLPVKELNPHSLIPGLDPNCTGPCLKLACPSSEALVCLADMASSLLCSPHSVFALLTFSLVSWAGDNS